MPPPIRGGGIITQALWLLRNNADRRVEIINLEAAPESERGRTAGRPHLRESAADDCD